MLPDNIAQPCEHEGVYECYAPYGSTTNAEDRPVVYRRYYCKMVACLYPDRKCHLK